MIWIKGSGPAVPLSFGDGYLPRVTLSCSEQGCNSKIKLRNKSELSGPEILDKANHQELKLKYTFRHPNPQTVTSIYLDYAFHHKISIIFILSTYHLLTQPLWLTKVLKKALLYSVKQQFHTVVVIKKDCFAISLKEFFLLCFCFFFITVLLC